MRGGPSCPRTTSFQVSPPGRRSRPTSSTVKPFAAESTSGDRSTSACARASAASSGLIGRGRSPGSGSRSQACWPSKARTPVWPCTTNSVRIRFGRLSSSTNGGGHLGQLHGAGEAAGSRPRAASRPRRAPRGSGARRRRRSGPWPEARRADSSHPAATLACHHGGSHPIHYTSRDAKRPRFVLESPPWTPCCRTSATPCASCARAPASRLVAIATLALGIGANTAIFSVVDSVLLQPLPYSQPDRLVRLMLKFRDGTGQSVSIPKFMAWKENTQAFQYMCAYNFSGPGLNISGGSMPEQVKAIHVSADFFPVFDAATALGRVFSAEEDRPGGPALAVMSHGLWVRRFGGDPGAVGRVDGAERRAPHRDRRAAGLVPLVPARRPLPAAAGRARLHQPGALPRRWRRGSSPASAWTPRRPS